MANQGVSKLYEIADQAHNNDSVRVAIVIRAAAVILEEVKPIGEALRTASLTLGLMLLHVKNHSDRLLSGKMYIEAALTELQKI